MQLEYLSSAFERAWGKPRDAVTRNLDHWVELVHPEDRQGTLEAMPRLLVGEAAAIEYLVVRPSDGAVRWIVDRGFPIPDEQGRIHRVAHCARHHNANKRKRDYVKVKSVIAP
jgi:PAS domain S-box-containing protein